MKKNTKTCNNAVALKIVLIYNLKWNLIQCPNIIYSKFMLINIIDVKGSLPKVFSRQADLIV